MRVQCFGERGIADFRQRSLCPQSAAVAARLGKADLMHELLRLMGDDASAVIAAHFQRLVEVLRQRGFGCRVAAFAGGPCISEERRVGPESVSAGKYLWW